MFKIFRVSFPFSEDTNKTKSRPALQLTKVYGRHRVLVIAYITSQVKEILETDVLIDNFKGFGLAKKSIIRLHKLSNIPISSADLELGTLPKDYEAEVKIKLKKMFGL